MTQSTITAQATPGPKPETAEAFMEEIASGFLPVLNYLNSVVRDLMSQFWSFEGLYQVVVILLGGGLAWVLAKPVRVLLLRALPPKLAEGDFLSAANGVVSRLVFPIVWVLAVWIGTVAMRDLGVRNDLVRIVANLLQAWILIRLFSTFVRDPMWSKTFATVAWVIAALNILNSAGPLVVILDSAALKLGDARLSLYMVLKAGILLGILLWLASLINRFVDARLSRTSHLTPSIRTLIIQAIRIGLVFGAVVLAMNTIGIDLTALTLFSGAVGFGIGFGLQAIFSNLVAGIIMLLDRSIKVGDFVELESGLTGEVREINIRSTRVTTNDNVDILVPNSEFINKQVTNWTLREAYRRTRIPFGVAYGTDKELVKKAALEAAAQVPHMLTGPHAREPEVWLVAFGDNSLSFELVVWLSPEAVKRPTSVLADYNWAIDTALAKYGIEIPFPQRDLHIRSGNLPIRFDKGEEPPEL